MIEAGMLLLFVVLGYGTLYVSRTYHLPEPIILILLGISMQYVASIDIYPLIVLGLIFLLFDAGTHMVPRRFDTHAALLLRFITQSIIANSIIIGGLMYLFIKQQITPIFILTALLLGSLATACSQFELFKTFKIKHNRLYNLTQLEDHISNPVVLTIAIVIFALIKSYTTQDWAASIIATSAAIFVDIAVGTFFGIVAIGISAKVLQRKHITIVSMVIAPISYAAAFVFDGTGFLAVIITSLFFHNSLAKVPDMGEFSPVLSNTVYIVIFLAMGYAIIFTKTTVILAVILLILYILVRYILLRFLLHTHQGFITLDCPKGLAVGAMTLVFMPLLPHMHILFSGLLLFYTFCIILSYCNNIITHNIMR